MEKNVIDRFLGQYSSTQTKNSYRAHLYNYFCYHGYLKRLPTAPISYETLKNVDEYLSNGKDYSKDIEEWWINDYSKRPPNTRNQGLSAIKMFFMENDTEFKKMFWRRLTRRCKGKGTITQDKVPTPQELKDILQHSKSITSKSLFMVLATSGMRVHEALSITIDDINLHSTPARINIPASVTKSGEKRIVFVTEEAKQVLKEYIDHYRTKYLDHAAKKCKRFSKDMNDNRVFPMCYNTANLMWLNMLKNADKKERDKTTDIHKFHIHTLRKFFRSRMGNKNGIGTDMTEFLMGHEGYLTREYRNYTEEELGEEYLKGSDRLLIFEREADTSDIREQLQEKDDRIKYLEKQIEEINKKLDQGVSVYLYDQLQKLKKE